jgi:hypothetical protein
MLGDSTHASLGVISAMDFRPPPLLVANLSTQVLSV